jgi:4-diphosphocytidyl-2-C-methyl-D-erythritol kinase
MMRRIRLRAPGKINWTLDVIGKRADGYHEVEMLMQSVGLWDEIVLTHRDQGVEISCDAAGIPLDDNNLAVRAAMLIKKHFDLPQGIHIDIRKSIPAAAGLAGGSSNAAAVLAGLNVMWRLGLSLPELAELGNGLGADVPFCILGGTAVARGIGEKLTPLQPLEGIRLVLVKPSFGVSTASVFGELKLDKHRHPDWRETYNLLRNRKWDELNRGMGNVLETVTAARHPEIYEIKELLLRSGAAASQMTGSGPAVFGVFKTAVAARRAVRDISPFYSQIFMVSTHGRGVEIMEGGSL